MEAQETVQLFLPIGISVVAVDFCGSGLSDGDYVTLGWYERVDLKAIVDFLRSDSCPFMVDKIAIWGRSMGAVTSLFFTHSYPSAAVAQVHHMISFLSFLKKKNNNLIFAFFFSV